MEEVSHSFFSAILLSNRKIVLSLRPIHKNHIMSYLIKVLNN